MSKYTDYGRMSTKNQGDQADVECATLSKERNVGIEPSGGKTPAKASTPTEK